MAKKKLKFKWDWKIFFIILFLLLWLFMGYSYGGLEREYQAYQDKVEAEIYELALNLTGEYANMDCYERGTVDCYEGQVFCYDEPKITKTCNEGYSLICVKD